MIAIILAQCQKSRHCEEPATKLRSNFALERRPVYACCASYAGLGVRRSSESEGGSNPCFRCGEVDCFASLAMTAARSWRDQRIAVFGQMQDLRDADLYRRRDRKEFRPLAGLTLDRVDGVEANIDAHALRDKALDRLAAGVVGPEQVDAGAE